MRHGRAIRPGHGRFGEPRRIGLGRTRQPEQIGIGPDSAAAEDGHAIDLQPEALAIFVAVHLDAAEADEAEAETAAA